VYQYRVRAVNVAGSSGYATGQSVTTPAAPAIHVGDLDGSRSTTKKSWTAKVTVAVHDASHAVVSGATVSFTWGSGGSGSCTTGSRGTCTLSASGIPTTTASVTFSVVGVTKSGSSYQASANHDAEGDSNGTVITVNK
jgi:hypothetical protein